MYDGFIAKYTANGAYLFSNQIQGKNYEIISDLVLKSNNKISVTGNFSDTSFFNTERTKKLVTINPTSFIADYNANNGSNINANAFGTYRTFNPGSSVVKMAHDAEGNVYIAGNFQGIVDFDPGFETKYLTSSQDAKTEIFNSPFNDNIFFARYNANGKLIFAKSITGTSGQIAISIAVDNFHNVYLAGGFDKNMDADPGEDSAILQSNHYRYSSYFISKYDSLGNYIFSDPIYIQGYLNALAVDKQNNIFIAGSFSSGYFNPANDTAEIHVEGSYIYFAKYNTRGKFIYLKSIGQKNVNQFYDACADITVNGKGNVLLCGKITGTAVDFDPGINTYLVNVGNTYVHFLASYSAAGNFLFETNSIVPDNSSTTGSSFVKFDDKDNILVSGNFSGTVQFDAAMDSVFLSPSGISSVFFIKYDPAGKIVFVKTLSATNRSGSLGAQDADLDTGNNIYLTGLFQGQVDFDPGEETAYLKANGMHSIQNIYIAKYDSSGNYLYAYNFAPTDSVFDRGASVPELWIDKNSNITLAVNTNGNIDFAPGVDTFYYHPPFDYYPTQQYSYSFVVVKFTQTQTAKPFKLFASAFDIDKAKPLR